MYKSLIGKSPLRFNSSLLLKFHFDALMEQIFMNVSHQVDNKGLEAWEITLLNIKIFYRMYGRVDTQWEMVFSNSSHNL